MADRPIIFSAPMIRALLDGLKTQTRRLAWRGKNRRLHSQENITVRAPTIWQAVRPRDRLWVREVAGYPDAGRSAVRRQGLNAIAYRAEQGVTEPVLKQYRYRSPIHMPRWASRLTLVVTAVKIERVQEISFRDVRDEGLTFTWLPGNVAPEEFRSANWRAYFAKVWDSLHGKPGTCWDANPEVVVLTFTVNHRNIDARTRTNA